MCGNSLEEQLAEKRVLVTGATGFIGSHLVERLVSLNAQVIATGPYLGMRPIVKKLIGQGCVRFVILKSFWCPSAIDRVRANFQGVEYVVHLAYVMPRGNSPLEKAMDDFHRNVLGTLQFIKQLPDSVSKICFASSSMVYGANPPRPVSETNSVNPLCVYSLGKLATENYLRLYAKEKEISTSILRYATVYGAWETVPRAIPNFIRRVLAGKPPVIYGNGDDIRDYVHVSDVVEATLLAMTHAIENFQVFNVGSGKGFSTLEIAEKVIQLIDSSVVPSHELAHDVTKQIVCDITKARKTFGYQPKVELNKGLMEEINYFSENPKLWREL